MYAVAAGVEKKDADKKEGEDETQKEGEEKTEVDEAKEESKKRKYAKKKELVTCQLVGHCSEQSHLDAFHACLTLVPPPGANDPVNHDPLTKPRPWSTTLT